MSVDMSPASDPISIAGVSLAVRDLQAVQRFYQEALGLAPIGGEDGRVRLGVGGVALLELRADRGLLPRDPAAAGLFHTAFLLPTREDLGRWLNHAAESGLRLDGAADHLVSEAVYLHDPEGNGIEVYADRKRSTWQWQDGQVAMANSRLDIAGLRGLSQEAWAGAPTGTVIGHVHLQVGAVEPARQFYAGRLGLDVVRDAGQALFLSSGGYHHHLACNTWHSEGAGPRAPGRAGLAEVVLQTASGGAPMADPWGTSLRFVATGDKAFA